MIDRTASRDLPDPWQACLSDKQYAVLTYDRSASDLVHNYWMAYFGQVLRDEGKAHAANKRGSDDD
jgi:hypothetical protein